MTPTPLSELQVAFQQQAGADFINVLGLYKIYYQTPLGSGFSAVIGPRVGQQEVLPMWPTAYSGELLHLFNMNGAPFAYNQQIGRWGLVVAAQRLVCWHLLPEPGCAIR